MVQLRPMPEVFNFARRILGHRILLPVVLATVGFSTVTGFTPIPATIGADEPAKDNEAGNPENTSGPNAKSKAEKPAKGKTGAGAAGKGAKNKAAKGNDGGLGKWEILFIPPKNAPATAEGLPKNSPLEILEKLEIVGPQTDDPFVLGKYFVNGRFGIEGGALKRTEGQNAAIRLSSAADFELEGMVDASGVGGWFLLLGYHDGDGYLVSQVTKRVSGSPWRLTRLLRNESVLDEDQEFNSHEWKGPQAFVVKVRDAKLSLNVGTARLADELPLPEYAGGDIILGTYDTRYGATDVKIQTLRIRRAAVTAKP